MTRTVAALLLLVLACGQPVGTTLAPTTAARPTAGRLGDSAPPPPVPTATAVVPTATAALPATPAAPTPATPPPATAPPEEPGRLVDVGGRKLHARCAGSGSPAVVVEGGLDAPTTLMPGWGRVLADVASLTRVCLYDRGNLGKSDFAPRPRGATDAADDLARLLDGLKLPAPYVLVGHSFGGHVVRLHAHRHPEQVAGLVLVDPSPDAATMDRMMALLPPERQVEFWVYGALNRAGIDTRRGYEDVRHITGLPDRPTLLLLAGRTATNHDAWFPSEAAQRIYREGMTALAATSPHAVERVAEQSQHDIPEQHPAAVAEAIRDVVERARRPARG